MKSERLLAMLLLLQSKGRASARQIAASLEVSERTIYRDLDSLSAAGIPVHAERGSGGGIVLAEGYRRALMQFREDEISALFATAADALTDVGLGDNLRRALEKLAGGLTDAQRRTARESRGRIHIDPRRWRQAAQPREMLAALRRATNEDLRTLLHYRDRNGKVTERVVDPLGLVAKAGIWYLVARYGDGMRCFRADRMIGVEVTTERFVRPAGFDLDAYWRDWSAEFERGLPGYPVMLGVAADALEDVCAYWDYEMLDGAPRRAKRGWKTVRLLFPSLDVAVAHIVMWGKRVEALEPAVRAATLSKGREAVKAYQMEGRGGRP